MVHYCYYYKYYQHVQGCRNVIRGAISQLLGRAVSYPNHRKPTSQSGFQACLPEIEQIQNMDIGSMLFKEKLD